MRSGPLAMRQRRRDEMDCMVMDLMDCNELDCNEMDCMVMACDGLQ